MASGKKAKKQVGEFALSRSRFEPYIQAIGLDELSLEQAEVDRDGQKKEASLRSWAWSSGRVAWARLTTIETEAGFRVANWAAFPCFDVDAPMCQAELIEVKGKLFLLVLDALYDGPEGRGPGTRQLDLLGRSLQWATPVDRRPDWSQGFITPGAIWSRAGTSEALEEGIEAFHRFMQASVVWLQGRLDGRGRERAQLYARMRARFLENEPSRPFMTKTFGGAWSEAYMENFLFPPREGRQVALEKPISAVSRSLLC